MVIKLGINGFGRIGRVIFRAGLKKANLEIAAINDPAIDVEYICYLIKFDSTHGKFNGTVTNTKDEIVVDDCRIKVFHEKLPSNVPWQTAGVQYVIEASGMFTSLEKASGHLASDGVKRVIVTAPSVDVPMIILGVNQDKLSPGQKVISCASSTLYCLAPIVKVLEDSYGVAEGFITSIHAMTPSLKPLDGLCLRGKHWRDHRSIHQNIIPATTGACKALGRILPRVRDRLAGLAFRVPIVNVSVLDLTVRLNTNTTIRDIIESVEKAGNAAMRNIIKISKEEAVSSDFIGETHSCVLDADSSLQLKPNFFKLVCWYENEYSYACRVLDLIFYLEKQAQLNSTCKSMNLRTAITKQDVLQQTDTYKKDILYSTLQEIGFKPKHQQTRSLTLRKPISSHSSGTTQYSNYNKDTKKRNEIFKIWDDVKEVPKPIRQNRPPFFHSCVTITPQNREEIECIKAQERLEMLKKEFSKMVNITESLLKKSYISTTQVKSNDKPVYKEISKSVNILPDINVEEIKHSCETFTEIYDDVPKSSPLFDIDDGYRSSVSSRNANILDKPADHCSIQDNTPKFQIHPPKKPNYESLNKLIIFEKVPKDKLTYNALNKRLPEKFLKITHDNEDKVKVNTNLETKDTQNIQVQYCVVENTKKFKDNKNIQQNLKVAQVAQRVQEKEIMKWKSRIGNTDSGFFSLFKKNSAADIIRNKKTNDAIEKGNINNSEGHTSSDCKNAVEITENQVLAYSSKQTAMDNNNIIEDKSYNIEDKTKSIEDKSNNIEDKTNSIEDKSNNIEDITLLKSKPESSNDESQSSPMDNSNPDDKIIKNYSEDIILDPVSTESAYTSKCGSPDNTSLTVSNVEVYKHKQDIYDKLDSISGTDSNNSFQMNERKSQIINISDLTSSLEDLARLDKICKIIEISDELSNKLFSALDSTDGISVKKKKWSFKDLCEKIKLDEFCEKIFGKSSD